MREYMRKRYRRLKREAEHERGRKRFWTPEAIEWLHHAFPNQNTKKLAVAMGRPYISVSAMASKLKIRKSVEFYRSEASGRMSREDHRGRLHQFPKGHVPANKGLRRPGYAPGRMAETMFKKGQVNGRAAQHLMPIGATRLVDGYVYVKVAAVMNVPYTVNWLPLHVLNWERANGRPLPPGHCLAFRDRDRMNVELDNLELITRAENMRRNTVHNLPKPLAELVQLRGALVRQINRRSGRHEKQDRGSEGSPIRSARGAEEQGQANGPRSSQDDRRRRPGNRQLGKGRSRRAQSHRR
jgi:hypothetical protein